MAVPFFHGTFTIKRVWSATPERIFSAWARIWDSRRRMLLSYA
jgi:hypothetical protein